MLKFQNFINVLVKECKIMRSRFRIILMIVFFIFNTYLFAESFNIFFDYEKNIVVIENEKGKPIYSLSETDAKIYSAIELRETSLYYIDNKNCMVEYDLQKGKQLCIENVGDFAFSQDGKYLCIGKICEEFDNSEYTLRPKLINKDFEELNLTDIDYDFLKGEEGISTHIQYENNKFIIKYNWDTPIPQYVIELELEDYAVKRLK